MLTAKKIWLPLPKPNPQAISQLQEELKTTKNPYFLSLMVSRGILSFEQAKNFMVPSLADLPDPFLMQDMEIAVERLALALENGEKINHQFTF